MIKDVILVLSLLLVPYLSMTLVHENAHGAIGAGHGCLESKYGIDLQGAYYQCQEYRERSAEWQLQERELHAMNEIIGYHLIGFLYSLAALIIFTAVVIRK